MNSERKKKANRRVKTTIEVVPKRHSFAMTRPKTASSQEVLDRLSIIPQDTTYNEWAESEERPRTIVTTETLMSRPFSTFKALRELDTQTDGNEDNQSTALVWADTPLAEGEEEFKSLPVMSLDGFQMMVGAVMGLLGHSLNSKEGRLMGVSLISQRRQTLRQQKKRDAFTLSWSKLTHPESPRHVGCPFPFAASMTLAKQPTWNDYPCFQSRLLTGNTDV